MTRFVIPAAAATVFVSALFLLRDAGPGPAAALPSPARSGAMEALEFWTASRAYPADDIPPDGHYRAYTAARRNVKELPRELASSATWEPIGPVNLHGRSLSVAINPQNRNTVYLGTASGGLWRSTGGGLGGDWTMVNTGFPVTGVGAILIDPVDTNVMYVGTGEVYRYLGATGGLIVRTTRGSYGIGILKTTDGGATWSKSLDWTYNQQRGVQAMALNPLNRWTVWAATTEGMFKSTDGGASWSNTWPVVMATDLVVHPTDTGRVLGAFGNLSSPSGGLYLTSDGGASWLPVGGVPSYSGKTQLHGYRANPDWVYASVCDSTTGVGALWRTTDFGGSWTQLSNSTTNSIFGVQGWYSHYAAVHPTDSTQVFHAAVGASKSVDGGATFLGTSGLYSDNHGFAIDPVDPDIIYSANDDGIYRSTNFGQSFTSVGEGLQTGQLYKGLASSTTDSNIALVQSQDHIPGYIYTGGLSWGRSAIDEAGWTAIDPVNDSVMYAVFRFGRFLYKSTNRGTSFFFAVNFSSNPGAWNTPVVVAPSNPSTVFYGTTRIYRSTNGGTAFSDISGLLDGGNPALSLGVPATTVDTLYAGMSPLVNNTDVFRWVNGTGWTNITGTLPDRYPMDIRVDPTNAAVVYIAMGGFGAGHVFKSTDAGATWTDITGTLPDAPATSIAIDPLNPQIVYVGNDISVYVSTDGGSTWSGFGEGLPEGVIVSDLSISPSNRSIRVGTHGNGAYERRMVNEVPPGFFDYKAYAVVSPGSGAVVDAGDTVSPLRASFRNSGLAAGIDSFDVELRILLGAVEVVSSTARTAALAVAEIREVTFPGEFTPADTGLYEIQAICHASDDDAGNDTLSSTIRVVPAPSIQTYSVAKVACPYVEIVGGAAGPSGDDAQMTVPLPFPFAFDGYTYDKIQISTNGWLEFGVGAAGSERGLSSSTQLGCCGANQNGRLGSTSRPTKALGPWWEDLNTDVSGAAVTYLLSGTAPSRTFTIQWKNMRAYYSAATTTTTVNFQVRLHETSNAFDFSYGPVAPGTFGGSDIGAMTGMKDFLGGDYRYIDFATGLTGPAGDVTTTLSPLTDWPGPDSCYHVVPSGSGAVQVRHAAGWNLVSVPVAAPDPAVITVYPTVLTGTTWAFGMDSGYTRRDTLEPGEGYWSKFPAGVTQPVAGVSIESIAVSLEEGWNIIGSLDRPVSAPSGGVVSGSVWGYDAGYVSVATLEPGKGYWVKASSAGSVTIGPTAAKRPQGVRAGGVDRIVVADADGRRQELFLAGDPGSASIELPPAPPGGSFDARFPGNRAAAFLGGSPGDRVPLMLSGAAWPVTITRHAASGGAGVSPLLVTGGPAGAQVSHRLEDGAPIAVEGGEGTWIALAADAPTAAPVEFALGTNYPNPFNPATTIGFDLPVESRVALAVYNLVGQRVMVLADGLFPAGRHAVTADLAGLPSGVYVYRIRAGVFSDARKMLLVR